MRCFVMFVTAVCILFLLKFKWPKNKSLFDGIRVGRIRTFPFFSDSAYDSVAYDLVKTKLSESAVEAEIQPITRPRIEHCDWFTLPLLLAIPTMQFSRS